MPFSKKLYSGTASLENGILTQDQPKIQSFACRRKKITRARRHNQEAG